MCVPAYSETTVGRGGQFQRPSDPNRSVVRRTMGFVTTLPQAQRVAPLQARPPGQLLIHEIYKSIQGESTFPGRPCVFVRLAVCDSRCVWCDTPHAFTQGTAWTPGDIVKKVLELACPLVEITGGEPLVQPEVLPLMTDLCDRDLTVLLETSGAHD